MRAGEEDEGRELDLGEMAQRRPTRSISGDRSVMDNTILPSVDNSPSIPQPFYHAVRPKKQDRELIKRLGSAGSQPEFESWITVCPLGQVICNL